MCKIQEMPAIVPTLEHTAEIDTTEDAVFVVKGGRVTRFAAPITGFGEQIITWQDGKPVRINTNISIKI